MQIERTEREIVIRIPAGMSERKVQQLLDLIRYSELTAGSTATQEDVDRLSSEINKTWWAKNRSRFIQ